MEKINYRETNESDTSWIEEFLASEWGSPIIVTRGKTHDIRKIPGIVAELDGKPVGLATYVVEKENLELITLNVLVKNNGIGTGLIEELKHIAEKNNCDRLWLITTNDNTDALRFYQKKGFQISAIYPNAVEASRKIKPEIPSHGNDGIPIRDEVELEILI